MGTEQALRFTGVTKSFGKLKAVQELSFSIPVGKTCAFVGANGAGKTTTFSLVAGFLRPDAGTIEIAGVERHRFGGVLNSVGVLPQEVSFIEERSVQSQLVLFAKLLGLSRRESKAEVSRVLDAVGLSEKAKATPAALSRGMRVRLGIAQALLGSPTLILLDEPLAGLDPVMRAQIRDLIRGLREVATVVVSSHELGELETFCDYICLLEKGRKLFAGDLRDVLIGGDVIEYTLTDIPNNLRELDLSSMRGTIEEKGDDRILIRFSDMPVAEVNRYVLTWLFQHTTSGVLQIRSIPTLEDAYFRFVERPAS